MSKRKPHRPNDRSRSSGQTRPNEQRKPDTQDIPEAPSAAAIPRDGLTYDPDNTLAGGLYAMTPKEAVALGVALCAAVEGAVGADGCHRGVWPGNITCADGQVALGPANSAGIAEMSPDTLEFISPEQFWSGKSSPASDVYSIGLVLYTALNRGVKPYFAQAEDADAETRARALEQRMRGEPLPYPATASRELGDVVLKAAAYQVEERYATPGKLKAALESLPEGGLVPAVAPVVPLSEEELKNAHSYKVDKDFEPVEEEKAKRDKKPRPETGEVDENMPAEEFRGRDGEKPKLVRWLIPVLFAAVLAVILFLILRGGGDKDLPIVSESPTPFSEETDPPETTAPTDPPEETDPPAETDPPEETDLPEETDPPAETPPAETGAPVIEDGRNWSNVILADVSWTEAKALCEAEGGHLAVLGDEEDLAAAVERAKAAGAQFVWLGGYRENGVWYSVTGEQLGYVSWDAGKPAGADYLMLWYRAAAGAWSCTDQIDDPLSVLPAAYGGRIGYICAYD